MNDNHRQSDDGSMNDKDLFSGISFEDNPAEDQNTSFGNDLNKELDSLFSEDLDQSSFLQDIFDGVNTGKDQGRQVQEEYNSQKEIRENGSPEIQEKNSADKLEEIPPSDSDRQQEDQLENLVEEILRADLDSPEYEGSGSAQEPAGIVYCRRQ